MKELFIDIETYASDVDLAKSGVYAYSASKTFEILLFAYSVDGNEVEVVDLKQGEEIPPHILDAIIDPKVKKFSFNAQFERVCLSRLLCPKGGFLDPSSWYCDMVHSAYLGLPLSLENVGNVLGDRKSVCRERVLRAV